jgi:hypothetical protein
VFCVGIIMLYLYGILSYIVVVVSLLLVVLVVSSSHGSRRLVLIPYGSCGLVLLCSSGVVVVFVPVLFFPHQSFRHRFRNVGDFVKERFVILGRFVTFFSDFVNFRRTIDVFLCGAGSAF